MYIGLDVHKRGCYRTATDDEGHIVKNGKFSSDPEGRSNFMESLDEAQVAMEAGYRWQPLYNQLLDAGYDVRLAHPQKVNAIAEAKVKTDKIDSETLAYLLRAGRARTLRLHINSLVDGGIIVKDKLPAKVRGRHKFTYSMLPRSNKISVIRLNESTGVVSLSFNKLSQICRFEKGGYCKKIRGLCYDQDYPQIR